MAFRSNGPVTLALPAFRGVTRQIILLCVVTFFAFWILASFVPAAGVWLVLHLTLIPDRLYHGWVWQLLSYPVFPIDLLSELFALLTVWFFGSTLEDERGSRWLQEFFFISTAGGGLLACLIALLLQGRAFGIDSLQLTRGLWPFNMALVLAFAFYNPEQELTFNFLFRLKAKYLAAVYLLVYLGLSIRGNDRFGALTAVCAALAGWLYMRFAPRQGMGFSASESWYSVRNAFYRNKRRRAAKKFQVYMKEQNRDVQFDKDGRYVDPDLDRDRRDPTDKRWMN